MRYLEECLNTDNLSKYKIFQGGTAANNKDSYKYTWTLSLGNKFDAVMVLNNEKPLKQINMDKFKKPKR